MDTASLSDFIKSARERHATDEQITEALTSQGWSDEQIQNALKKDASPLEGLTPPKPPSSPTIKTGHFGMWVSFQHVLLFISLYVMATSITLLVNHYVDMYVPPVGSSNIYYRENYMTQMAIGYASALLVSFPFFAYFFLTTNKLKLANPEITRLKSRSLLIYLTLTVTFIVMLWLLVATVHSFLSGNISFNFVLHMLVTALVNGAIFAYYLHDVRHDRSEK